MSRVLVAGDVHLGADNADEAAFEGFLDQVYADRANVDEVVLLGDCWDMIRRDAAGVLRDTTGTVERLNRLGTEVPITYVLGNHDTYVRAIEHPFDELAVREGYTLDLDGTRVHFSHGNEFDALQFDWLSRYLSGPGERGDIDPTRGLKDPVVAKARDAIGEVKSRLRTSTNRGVPTYPRRERRAHDYLETIPADKLVYGHTHAPYVHHDNRAANAGSWKTTPPVHNTYLEIDGGDLTLNRYREDGPDEPLA